jgi:hypothetical protein
MIVSRELHYLLQTLLPMPVVLGPIDVDDEKADRLAIDFWNSSHN